MKTYDEIVENVIEATAAHRRRVKKIQQIAAASVMCTACIFGLSVYLNLEPQQVMPPSEETTTVTFPTLNSADPGTVGTEGFTDSNETPGNSTTPGDTQTPSTDMMEPPAPAVTDESGQTAAPPESGEASTGTGMISTETNAEQGSTVAQTDDLEFVGSIFDPTEPQTEGPIWNPTEPQTEGPIFDPTDPTWQEPSVDRPHTKEPTTEGPSWTIPNIDNPAETAPLPEEYETTQAVHSTATTTTTTTSVSARALAGRTFYTTTAVEPLDESATPAKNAQWLSWVSTEAQLEEKFRLQDAATYETQTIQFPIE